MTAAQPESGPAETPGASPSLGGLWCRWRPALAAGLLLGACPLLLSARWIPQGDGQARGQAARRLPLYAGPPPGKGQVFWAYTDRGRPVPLVSYPDRPPPGPELAAAEGRWLRTSGLDRLLVRTGPPTMAYVCHDWVFTDGRYSLTDAVEEEILQDNGYEPVPVPQAGDLAVYRDRAGGTLMHTGVVRSVAEGGAVLVESKWAWMGRYLHPADVYCYPGAVCTFYHSPRAGHLLRGLDGSSSLSEASRESGPAGPAGGVMLH